jgi:four helix bundle protein
MKPAKRFQDLNVWQKAHSLVLQIYKATRKFPSHEMYGLTSQIRRAAVSVPANIAEGFRRKGKPDKGRILNIAQASLEETRYYLILAQDLQYSNTADMQDSAEEVSRMLDKYVATILSPVS